MVGKGPFDIHHNEVIMVLKDSLTDITRSPQWSTWWVRCSNEATVRLKGSPDRHNESTHKGKQNDVYSTRDITRSQPSIVIATRS